uniref:Uncharacterized protein n=1 Tax=Anguilla anguilla TaxID=7936 RepID=A0A0E9UFN5_ANGAN
MSPHSMGYRITVVQ